MMAWKELDKEDNENLVVLGDAEGHVRQVAGALLDISTDRRWKKNRYILQQKNGEVVQVAGCAALDNRIGEEHLGCVIKLKFNGWANSPNGKFKDIVVGVWENDQSGDPRDFTDEILGMFPALKTYTPKKPTAKTDSGPAADDEEEDDLPF